MMRPSARLLLLSAVLGSLSAQVSKSIDLSTAKTAKKFYVVFASRNDTTTGHAFVVWGIEDGVRRCSSVKAFGLYPESDSGNCRTAFGTVSGHLVDEKINHSVGKIAAELIVQVDENAFNESMKAAREWDCRHDFSLISRDCVEFLRAVGNVLHLDMPRRRITRWTPHSYVQALLATVGTGTLDLEDAVYSGSLMNGQPMGHGSLIYSDGSRIDGTFWGLDHHVLSTPVQNRDRQGATLTSSQLVANRRSLTRAPVWGSHCVARIIADTGAVLCE
jgi:hypothetical protein